MKGARCRQESLRGHIHLSLSLSVLFLSPSQPYIIQTLCPGTVVTKVWKIGGKHAFVSWDNPRITVTHIMPGFNLKQYGILMHVFG